MNQHVPLAASRRATYADVLAASEGMTAEVLDGELVLHPQPRLKHMRASTMLDIYSANGVLHLWFVDPEAFALVEGRWTLIAALAEDVEVRVVPFDAVAFSLAELWVHKPDDSV